MYFVNNVKKFFHVKCMQSKTLENFDQYENVCLWGKDRIVLITVILFTYLQQSSI